MQDQQFELKEECGIAGIVNHEEAARHTYLSLYALQHRGQEACGIVTIEQGVDGPIVHDHKGFGLVADNFSHQNLSQLEGHIAIGHVRYSTDGGRSTQNIQPFIFKIPQIGQVAIAHNGSLTNAAHIRELLEAQGSVFSTTTDSEVIVHLLAKSRRKEFVDKISDVMSQLKGAYSLVLMTNNTLYGVRDPYGFRPLVVGQKESSFVVVSETCALDLIDAEFIREVNAGEIVAVSSSGLKSYEFFSPLPQKASCSFEPIYFSRPDSRVQTGSIYELRQRMGAELAKETNQDADLVIAVPDSGVPLALGYARESNTPFEIGLVRNHYIGRTFIEPLQDIRDFGVKIKLNPVFGHLKGKRVVVVDDSLVRGTTSKKIVRMLRKAGAKEIHFRVGSPPISHSCYFGVSTPEREKLLAAQSSIYEICDMLEADSLAYLSLDGLRRALMVGAGEQGYCFACFNGEYPEEILRVIKKQPTDGLLQSLYASASRGDSV